MNLLDIFFKQLFMDVLYRDMEDQVLREQGIQYKKEIKGECRVRVKGDYKMRVSAGF